MNLEPIVTELRRQVTKLENWLRRLEDSLRDDEIMPQATVKGRALTAGTGTWQNLTVAELQALVGSTDFVMANGFRIQTDEIRALDSDGLEILDDGGNVGIVVTDGGTLQIGANTPLTGFIGAGQVQINKASNGTVLLARTSDDTGGVTLELLKRRVDWGVVTNGDRVATILFSAADSVDAAPVAQIHAAVDGAPGSNDMPGRLVFSTTADGANAVTEAMRITSAQRIGMGNAAPLYPVHIGAGADTLTRTETTLAVQVAGTATATLRDSTNDVELTTIATSTGGIVGTATAHSLLLATNNATKMSILSGGNVGIANTAPGYLLHVGAGADTLTRTEATVAVQVAGQTTLAVRDATNNIEAAIVAGTTAAAIGTATAHTLNLMANNAAAITILSDGKVGIANASPAYPVHIGAGADTLTRTDTTLAVQVAGTATATIRDATNNVELTMIAASTGGIVGTATAHSLLLATSNTVVASVSTAGQLAIKAGTSSGQEAAVGGVMYVTTSSAGNTGAGEDDLASYSVPADTLAVTNDFLDFEASGTAANNVNVKTLRVRFGSGAVTQVFSLALTTSSSHQWALRGRIYRTGAATQKSHCSLVSNFQFMSNVVTTLDHTLSGAATLKVTGEGVSNNDIVLQSFVVSWNSNNT